VTQSLTSFLFTDVVTALRHATPVIIVIVIIVTIITSSHH